MKCVYRKPNPHLFDVAIDEIQTALNNECAWLNNIFGRCERLVKEINGRKEFTANWYKAKNDYILIAPDEGLGNFCFFVLDEPTDLENYFAGDVTRSTIGFSLIVWCDLRTIGEGRDTEAVKEELLQILNGRTHLRSGRMTIDKVYERAENIFREFDYDEIDNQYLMHPFAGFRIQGELIVDTLCDSYIPPTPPVIAPYIKGHLFEYQPTFSFVVNENETIVVNVDKDGWWKWEADRVVTSLTSAFRDVVTLDKIEFFKIQECTTASNMLQGCSNLNSIKIIESFAICSNLYALTNGCNAPKEIIVKNTTLNNITSGWRLFISANKIEGLEASTFEKVTSGYQMFNSYTGRALRLDSARFISITNSSGMFSGATRLEELRMKEIKLSFSLANSPNLSKDSVLSCINAAIANITITLNSAVYSKCASGGEWHTDIQAAIDAKAAQGFTVTLISA